MRGLVYLALLFAAFVLTGLPLIVEAASAPAFKQTHERPIDDVDQSLPADNLSNDIACCWRPFRRRRCCMNSDGIPSTAVATFDASTSQG